MFKIDSMRWAIALWLLMLFSLAMAPLPVKVHLHTIGRWHGAGHTVAFLVTTGLLLWNARSFRSEVMRFAAALTLAFLMELLENFFYHAGFEWHDILFDVTGMISAWVITSVIRSGQTSQQPTKIQ